MDAPPSWPNLSWDPAPAGAALDLRVRQIAELATRFEAALEQAAEQEQADLSALEKDLDSWDRAAAEVFVHTGLGEGRPVTASRLPALRKAYGELRGLRAVLLSRLGGAAAGVVAREPKVEIEAELLQVGGGLGDEGWDEEESEASFFKDLPPEELRAPPDFEPPEGPIDGEIEDGEAFPGDEMEEGFEDEELADLGGDRPDEQPAPPVATPVRPEEIRLRQLAHAKAYPQSGTLGAMLALLPAEWIVAIHATLGLETSPDEDLSAGSRAALLRGPIFEHLRSPEGLAEVVASLGPKEREILGALLKVGLLSYARVAAKWGSDDADGYSWAERPESGPLSALRRRGLAFVLSRNGEQVVAAPTDLAEALKAALLATK